jgi:hypothetical protein
MVNPVSGSLRIAASGGLPPDTAWRRYSEPRLWSTWAPHIREVDYPHDVVTPGSSGRVTGLGGIVAVFTVDTVDHAARQWSWRVRSGPLRLRFEHGVDAAGDEQAPATGGSTGWVVVHGPWPVIAGYAPLARWSVGRLVSP